MTPYLTGEGEGGLSDVEEDVGGVGGGGGGGVNPPAGL